MAGPDLAEIAEIELRSDGDEGDPAVVELEGDADDFCAARGSHGAVGLEARGDDGEVELGGGILRRLFRLVVDAGVGEVGDADGGGLAVTGGGLVGVDGEEDGLEAGEGLMEAGACEVDAGEGGEEAEDDELELGLGGVEGVVEPRAEVVVDCAGVGAAEEGGDLGRHVGVLEEGGGGGLGGGEVRREVAEDGGEGLHGGAALAVGIAPFDAAAFAAGAFFR